MEPDLSYEIFPLGDSAVTIDLGNRICGTLNNKVLAMQQWLTSHPCEWIRDIILGYSSISILYDPIIIHKKYKLKTTALDFVKTTLEKAYKASPISNAQPREEVDLPVCYDESFGTDLSFIAKSKQLSIEEVINIHLSQVYRVYMMGFLPGFPYMGEVDKRIQVPRKQKPEPVHAGSVGIAAGQTGIYPLESPGGWQIIGRTPIDLFQPNETSPVRLRAGQSVRFYQVSLTEFDQLASHK
jgi:inhibitor of KinA